LLLYKKLSKKKILVYLSKWVFNVEVFYLFFYRFKFVYQNSNIDTFKLPNEKIINIIYKYILLFADFELIYNFLSELYKQILLKNINDKNSLRFWVNIWKYLYICYLNNSNLIFLYYIKNKNAKPCMLLIRARKLYNFFHNKRLIYSIYITIIIKNWYNRLLSLNRYKCHIYACVASCVNSLCINIDITSSIE